MIKLLAVTAAFLTIGMQTRPVLVKTSLKSIYDFKVTALDGTTIDFASFKGKKILIVNTASQCGYTPQYEGLQKL